MLIGLISDTHIPDRAKEIPEKVWSGRGQNAEERFEPL